MEQDQTWSTRQDRPASAEVLVPTLVSVGYEGRDLEDLVSALQRVSVSWLVDLRLNPISRKPGFSKTRLAAALAVGGIRYLHLKELGNPKDNRDSFRRGAPGARERYRRLLSVEPATAAVRRLAEMVTGETVGLLCFEHDHDTCHRSLVAEAVRAARPQVQLVQL